MSRTPDLPKGPTSTGDMGMSMFDMRYTERDVTDLLTKGSLPAMKRSLAMNLLNSALVLIDSGLPEFGHVLLNYVGTTLQAMVGEPGKHNRTAQFQSSFDLELHRDSHKTEEKPKI